MTQSELAERTGIRQSNISRIEKGEIRLTAVSEAAFEDDGHAIAWAMSH